MTDQPKTSYFEDKVEIQGVDWQVKMANNKISQIALILFLFKKFIYKAMSYIYSNNAGMMGQNLTAENLKCAFCHGTGKDCSNDCPVCGGGGYNKVGQEGRQSYEEKQEVSGPRPEKCGFCHGSGRELTSICPVCKGSGKVMVIQPGHKCTSCQGTGRSIAQLCSGCFGTGWACSI